VGRLDKASEGLLLLTNDSEWAAQVLAPESHLPKIYHVHVSGIRDAALADALMKGVRVSNGDFLRVKDARILRQGNRNTWLAITLDEGKNRHIRRMLEPLTLGDLAKGASRRLTAEEKSAIDAAMSASAGSRK
jgi:23S rRNA pseudouridine2605 synthase